MRPVTPTALEDYGFLSDCRSAAIVSRAGSIDWWCPERFDAPSVFGRLLDPDAGHWTISAQGARSTEWSYLEGTLVLRTVVETDGANGGGAVEIVDALALEPGARGHEIGHHSPRVLLRQVTGLRGTVAMRSELALRPEYGRLTPYLLEHDGAVTTVAGRTTLTLRSDVPVTCATDRVHADFPITAGDTVTFRLEYEPTYGDSGPTRGTEEASISATVDSWRSWGDLHQTYDGRYREQVLRSALVLQGLTYQRSGAVVAAATTSLPEEPGGDRNYDYRFAWLRDFALTMRALWVAACPDETDRLLAWVARSTGQVGDEPVPIMYGVEGERDLSEHELPHLRGYAESTPVRAGNDAWRQRQLDVLGEILDAAYLLRSELQDMGPENRQLLIALADRAADSWRGPDAGMWEARDTDRQYVSSKVMCWVALDRAVRLAPLLGAESERDRWAAARDEVHRTVVEEGWNEQVGAFTGALGSDELDASVLMIPLVGFLPADDARVRRTVAAVEAGLGKDGLLRRWKDDPAAFITCSYWLSECYSLAGDLDRAAAVFDRATACANDLGLFTEQFDFDAGTALGNLPQALCHVGLVNAAWRLTEAARPTDPSSTPEPEPPGPAESPREGEDSHE